MFIAASFPVAIGGALVGALRLGLVSDERITMGVRQFWQMIIKGLVVAASVMLDGQRRHLFARIRA